MPAYKDEARGTWYCRFRYTDYMGKKHETTKRGFKTKKAALQYEADFKSQSGDTSKLTMNALCDAYLKDKQVNQKASTYKSTEKIINSHIRAAFGRRPVNEITKLDIRQWQNDLLQKQAYNSRPYAPSTLRQIFQRANRQPADKDSRPGHRSPEEAHMIPRLGIFLHKYEPRKLPRKPRK